MRVLVVGTVPPPGGEAAVRLAGVAAELIAEGHSIEILSPDRRSAAHRYARLAGPLLAVELAAHARRFDAVVLNVEPGLPLAPTADRLSRGLTLAALGAVLRAYGEVTVRLPSPIPLPGGVGGRATRALWSRATTIVVANDEDRGRMVVAPGVEESRVVLESRQDVARPAAEPVWSELGDYGGDLRSRVQSIVRERAARDRAVNRARVALGARNPLETSDDPFEGAAGPVPRPSVSAVARLTAGRARRAAVKLARTVQPARSS